ncbi:MAG: cupin domain-containing protein [Ilumatobacteraceae bacterium]|jgi:hypothetical protein
MRIPKDDIPVKLDVPGAKARQLSDFGEASGTIGAEYFSLGTGTDIAPLLQGLEHDACHAPHWGYVISGVVIASYVDGTEDRCVGGDVFHWPPFHSVRVEQDAEVILFSPQHEHLAVMGHMAGKLGVA